MRRTCRKHAGGTTSAKGEGDGVPQHYLGLSRARTCAVLAAHALTAVTVPRASSEAVLWHISTAIEKPGGMCHAFARREPSVTSIASTAHGGRS